MSGKRSRLGKAGPKLLLGQQEVDRLPSIRLSRKAPSEDELSEHVDKFRVEIRLYLTRAHQVEQIGIISTFIIRIGIKPARNSHV